MAFLCYIQGRILKCMFELCICVGNWCEYRALDMGPQILNVIREYHSICKFSPCFQGNRKHVQRLLFAFMDMVYFCIVWKYVYFLNSF